jgi:predicted nucleic acid-binding protein
MRFEAIPAGAAVFGWPYQGIAQRLRRHPEDIRGLHRFRDALREIAGLQFEIFPVSDRDVLRAAEASQRYGLLSGDALVVAQMEDHGVTQLASHDADFDRVTSLARYTAI